MKKITCLGVVIFIFASTYSFGQTIDLPPDSVAALLCKRWEVDYALMGDMKIGRIPGAAELNYEFNKDKTFVLTSNDPKNKKKGTWAYDTKKKLIKLTVNGNSNTSIISLKDDELIMLADTKKATPDDPTALKLVYKIKAG